MRPNIVVVGSINRDLSAQVAELPRRGQTVLGGDFHSVSGGKGANQAVAAARYGAKVSFVGRLGQDVFGDELLAALSSEGIDVQHITRDSDVASGVALILVDADGENCITVAPGANARLSVADVESARETIASADILLLQLEIPLDAVRRTAEIASSNSVPVVLNPAPAQTLDDALLRLVSVFTPNATEAEFYTGHEIPDANHAREAATVLLDRVEGAVVLTLGSSGAVYMDRDGQSGLIGGCSVKAVDSTAAGDVFNGVLAVELAEGTSLSDAVQNANAAAALSVTQFGAQSAIPTRDEVLSFQAEDRPTASPSVHGPAANGHQLAVG